MKIKDVEEYVKHCNDVSSGYCDPFLNTPLVTAPKKHPDTIELSYDSFTFENVVNAVADLGAKREDPFDGEIMDLVLRRLRQLAKEEFRRIRKKVQDQNGFLSKAPQFRSEDLNDAFSLFLHKVDDFRIKRAIDLLKCTKPSTTLLEKMVLAWTGQKDPILTAVMAHWIWLIKRKLSGLPVTNHIMPILYGPQGAGKSQALYTLLKPLRDLGLTLTGSIPTLADERYQKVLGDHYVFCADEMGLAERTDVNVLKNIITADRLNPRKLGTNSAYDVRQNCTFIGTSNRPITEMIFDRTGMRRFFQIECLPVMNWAEINSINYWNLIEGIDERLEEGYLTGEVLDAVRAGQEKTVSHDDIHFFLEESAFSPCPILEGQFISNETVYAKYLAWIVGNGSDFKFSKHELLKRLRNRGFWASSKKQNGKTQRGLWIQVLESDSELTPCPLSIVKSGGKK